MLDDLFTLKDIAIFSIKYFQELTKNSELDHSDYIPKKNGEDFLNRLTKEFMIPNLDQSEYVWLESDNIYFIEFWRLYEELLQKNGRIQNDMTEEVDMVLTGMIHLRNKIIKKSINKKKSSDLTSGTRHGVLKISLSEIRQIIQEIVSSDNNNISSAYWSDVLNQVPNNTSSDIFLDILDINNSILQWLKEFLIAPKLSPIETANTILTRIITLKDVATNNLFDADEILCIESFEEKKNVIISESDKVCLDCNDLQKTKESSNEFFESLPWKGQTMFSNFRELQMSLQYLLERVSLTSNDETGQFSKRDELSIRKISHMITELEDFLYHQFDIRQKEKNALQTIETENYNLKKQLTSVIKELDDKKTELHDSISCKDKFEKEIESLFIQKNKLSADIFRLHEENRIIESRYEDTLAKLNSLTEEHMILKDEYIMLKAKLDKKNGKSTLSKMISDNALSKHNYSEDNRNNYSHSLCGDTEVNKYSNPNKSTYYHYNKVTNSSSEIQETHLKIDFEVPATISSLPEFLESEINHPVKFQNKVKHFRSLINPLEELRTINVVPTVIGKCHDNASIFMNSERSNQ